MILLLFLGKGNNSIAAVIWPLCGKGNPLGLGNVTRRLSFFLKNCLQCSLKTVIKMVFKGKYDSKVRESILKLKKEGKWTVKEICEICGVSRSTVKRVCSNAKKVKFTTATSGKGFVAPKKMGRPRTLNERDERKILRQIEVFRREDNAGRFSLDQIRKAAGLGAVPLYTIRRVLLRHGFAYRQARKKGLLTAKDLRKRYNFAMKMKRERSGDVWKNEISFYLDGKSFVHKMNPLSTCASPTERVWRKRSEGMEKGCTSRGSKCGTGGRKVNFLVCISHGHGVCSVTQYEKMDGAYFTSFVKNEFPRLFRDFGKTEEKLWIQDGDPSQNCKSAREAWKSLGAKLLQIPPRSPDVNPIENVFHLAVKALEKDTMEQVITHETFEQFVARVRRILHDIPISVIDKTIESVEKRINLIIANKGKRLKY